MFQWLQGKSKEVSKQVQGAIAQDMTLEQVRAAMLQLMAEENINHHRMGQLYNYVVDKKLAELANYKDAQDWFSQNLRDLSHATLRMYGTVARAFSEESARRFGVTCLSLLLTYKELAGLKVDHDAPGETPIDVPDAKGVVTTKPFAACTVDEMRRALQARRKPTSSKPLPPEDVAVVDLLTTEVVNRFQKGDPVKVQLRNHQGEAVMDLMGIPVAKRQKLLEALQAEAEATAKALASQQDKTPKA